MSQLAQVLDKMKRRLTQTERDAEEVFILISKLDNELRVAVLVRLGTGIEWKLKETQGRWWDPKDVRLLVKYRGEVDVIPPSEKSSPVFAVGLTVEQFVQALKRTAKAIREGSDADPFVLLKETGDEELFGFLPVRKKR